ncbi:MAG: DUF4912 domain-containing protein [Clostridia bacterium]|nr:DUF4912 domain-containing protein [Clostridia bacterium]
MPRKTKDSENQDLELKTSKSKANSKATVVKKVGTKKATSSKSTENKKSAAKSADNKKDDTKNEKALKSKTSTKKTASSKKTTSTKKSTTSKSTTTKKNQTKKTTTAKESSSIKAVSSPKIDIVEYYDLPYRYNQTIVRVLAQTPTNLFIYWDISDEDRENYKKQYGEYFFEKTKPVLKIYNDTMHYSFEVEINDFANSWYLHVNDSKCNYRVELGRRPINYETQIPVDYIYVSTSNKIESPNDKILFDKMQKMVYFKNVKTNSIRSKSVATLAFIRNMGKIYNIYDLYKELYKDENTDEFSNPSSRFF